ncbi:MAG: hypothetical protein ABIJ97_03160 [Bacteroidota bacterium]
MELSEFILAINKYYKCPDNYLVIEKEIAKYCRGKFGLIFDYDQLFSVLVQSVRFYPKLIDIVNIGNEIKQFTRRTDRKYKEIKCERCSGKGGREYSLKYEKGFDNPPVWIGYGAMEPEQSEGLVYQYWEKCENCGGRGHFLKAE